jgi:peptidylprolyl isomerase
VRQPLRSLLFVAPLLLAAACGSTSKTGGSASGSDPSVSGSFGAAPTVQIPKGTPPAALVTKVLQTGTGPAVAKGDLLLANYEGRVWATGTTFDSSFKRGQAAAFPIGAGQVIKGWDDGLVGQKAGSRVLLVIPPAEGYGTAGQPDAGIKGTDTLVFVVDIVGSYGPKAEATGTAKPQSDPNLPAVQATPGVKPVITMPAGKSAPAVLSKTVLIEGSGPEVKAGQQLVVQYEGVVWATGKQFDASWDRAAPASFVIGQGQLIKGWDDTIPGTKVGSRVLLVVPPDMGYGSGGQSAAGIKGTDTLVFVLDVLGAG